MLISYQCHKQHSIGVECAEVELHVEISLPEMTRCYIDYRVTLKFITVLESIWFVRVASDLESILSVNYTVREADSASGLPLLLS